MENLIFIGGIHGCGKGEICRIIVKETDYIHLTASEVLKWKEISALDNKKVQNLDYTQDRLLRNLENDIDSSKSYLLDGHFCLLNKNEEPERISFNTFQSIHPRKLIVLYTPEYIIKSRLEKRDKKIYPIELLTKFQNEEITYAQEISKQLKIPLLKIETQKRELKEILNFVK